MRSEVIEELKVYKNGEEQRRKNRGAHQGKGTEEGTGDPRRKSQD